MGLLFSTCRRRKDSAEREPLLPKHRVENAVDAYIPSHAHLTKAVDIIAALRAGKLPSQEQLNGILRTVLQQTALESGSANGPLSEPGRQVVSDLRNLVDAFLALGLEKNDDDEIQEFVFQLSQMPNTIPVHADVIVNAGEGSTVLDVQDVVGEIPSKDQAASDAAELIRATRDLSTILLTSSTFRIILSDLFKIAREVVADTAADVGRIAATVEASADKVEETLRPDDATLEDIKINAMKAEDDLSTQATAVSEETRSRWTHLSTENPERTKEAVVGRLQQAIVQAHNNPSYQRALRTILYLLQDYTTRLSNITGAMADVKAPDVTPVLWTDPPVSRALSHLSVLVSRMASGYSIETWSERLRVVIADISSIPSGLTEENDELTALRTFFADLGLWLNAALDSPHYATSPEGQREAEALYDRTGALLQEASQSDKPWARHLRDLIHETEDILQAISEDRTTNRFLDTVSAFTASLSSYAQTAMLTVPGQVDDAKRKLRAQMQRDVLQWLLPRVLRALHAIPMPRVEYKSNSLDAAIDTLYLTPASAQLSLIPDHIRVQNWTEVQLDMTETDSGILPGVEYTGMQTHTRLRVSISGVRVSARDVGYYACYRLFGPNRWLGWLGYEDEGLLSVDVGGRGADDEGLSLDVELEFQADSAGGAAQRDEPLFVVRDVRVDVPGLQLSLDRSKHWLLNKLLLQPLAGPIGRVAAAWVLRSQVEALLSSLGVLGGKVAWEAHETAKESRKDLELGDYAGAFWRVLSSPEEQGGNVETEEPEEPTEETPLIVDTHTTATTKGIVRSTVTYAAEADAEESRSPIEESVLAIGIGEQILPGKGGPHDANTNEDEYGPRDIARDALDEIQSRVDQAVEAEEVAVERSAEVRRDMEDAAAREQRKERRESVKHGWRSDAFDI